MLPLATYFFVVFSPGVRVDEQGFDVRVVDKGDRAGDWVVGLHAARVSPTAEGATVEVRDIVYGPSSKNDGVLRFQVPPQPKVKVAPRVNAVELFVTSPVCKAVHSLVVPLDKLPERIEITVNGRCELRG